MKNNKGFTLLVVVLLAVLGIAIVGGGYIVYKDKQQQNIIESQIKDLKNLPSKTDPISVDIKTNPSIVLSAKDYCTRLGNISGAGECKPSPNNKWVVYYTNNGLRLIEVATGKMTELSKLQDDRAILWFSDSQRILGFTGYFNQGGCEGCVSSSRPLKDSRMLTIWDISSKTHTTSLGVQTPPWSYDMEWITLDHTAYIYTTDKTGTEGDNFYYTLNLDSKSILGPTKNPKLR